MKKIKLINNTKDKLIEEIVTKVLVKFCKDNDTLDEVIILGEDEDKGEIYLSIEDTQYTVLVKDMENTNLNEYTVSWSLYKEEVEILSGEDEIKLVGLFKEEEYECVEFKVFNSNIDKSYIVGNIDGKYFLDKDAVNKDGLEEAINEQHFVNIEFEEYLEKHNIDDIKFSISPFGLIECPNRIQFEITQTNGGLYKAIICLRKIDEESGEFKIDDRYLAYEELHGIDMLNLIVDFFNEYYK